MIFPSHVIDTTRTRKHLTYNPASYISILLPAGVRRMHSITKIPNAVNQEPPGKLMIGVVGEL